MRGQHEREKNNAGVLRVVPAMVTPRRARPP